jgi:TRAP-type mannitol/chloroaromatic compound transport system permease large subunit
VVQGGSSLGILIPPSVVLVLYGMIARQPVSQLWLAGVFPGLLMATLFILYIAVRCKLQPHLGPPLSKEERDAITWKERIVLMKAGFLPFMIFFLMNGLFLMGVTSLVESSAVGALASMAAAFIKGRLSREVMDETCCVRRWAFPACSCGSFSRRCVSVPCLTGLARCGRSRTSSSGSWGLSPGRS